MAFYYEAEAPVWKYKERYGEWKKFPKRTGQKLEKLWKRVHVDGDTSTIEHEWKSNESCTYKINLQSMTATNMSSYYRNSDVSREGYPYPTPGNKNSLAKIHKKYVIEEEGETYFDLGGFFDKANIDPDGLDSLILLAMCEVETFVDVTKREFCDGLAKCGCSSLSDIRNAIGPIRTKLVGQKNKKVLKSFARWLFVAAKDDSARTISTTQLSGLLELMCPANKFRLSQNFVDFLKFEGEKEGGDRKTCSRDDWVMIVEFVADKNDWSGFADYVEDEGWPLIISECFEFSTKGGEN